jgi:hypothetical protein
MENSAKPIPSNDGYDFVNSNSFNNGVADINCFNDVYWSKKRIELQVIFEQKSVFFFTFSYSGSIAFTGSVEDN